MQSPLGRLVASRYRLVRELGRGGMGTVWLAEDQLIGRQVAVKELRPQGLTAEERDTAARRALQEARSAARIHHPGAVTLYDVLPATAADGAIYLIMELVEGPTLAQMISGGGPWPAASVAVLGLQLLAALAAAHNLGIVHRDVKPANILIAPGSQAKLTDFGIAHAIGDTRITSADALVGTPAYMAPERFGSRPVTPACDLWSLGVTLYYAVTGRNPFDRDSPGAIMQAVLTQDPPAPACPPPLAAAILSLLQRDPARRATIPQARVPLEQAAAAPVRQAARVVTQNPARGRRNLLIALAVVVVVLVVGTGTLIYVNLPSSPPSITVTGAFGKKPVVTIPKTSPPGSLQTSQLISGHGAAVAKGDLAVVDLTGYTWAGTKSAKISAIHGQPETLDVGSNIPGLDKSLEGSRVGSRLLITIPPEDGFGSSGSSLLGVSGTDTLVFVADVLARYTRTAGAHGTPEVVSGTGLPTVGTASPGTAPAVKIPATTPPSTLQSPTLIQGKGPVVKKGQLIVAQYEGLIWRTGKVFDSSWQSKVPAGFRIASGDVIPGWVDGLVGKRVGSRVLLVLPPADGYGSTGYSQYGITGTDTLVFVVDIVAAY